MPLAGAAAWQLASSAADRPPARIAGQLPQPQRPAASRRCWPRAAATQFTEAAVQAALQWLAANQDEDGRWDCSLHGGGREMKTLGHDRGGAGGGSRHRHHRTGPAGRCSPPAIHTATARTARNVRRGLEYVMRIQASDGNLAGSANHFARMYCHAIATFALSEAYGMTGEPPPGTEPVRVPSVIR